MIIISERMSSDAVRDLNDSDVVENGLNKRQIVCLRKGIACILPFFGRSGVLDQHSFHAVPGPGFKCRSGSGSGTSFSQKISVFYV